MAGEDQKLIFTLVFNKETGELQTAQQDLAKTGQAAAKSGEEAKQGGEKAKQGGKAAAEGAKQAESAAGKTGKEVVNMAKSFLIAQLAMQGFQAVAKQAESFQELQTTFEDTAATLVQDFKPALDLVSKGLQGLVVMAGGVGAILKPVLDSILASVRAVLDVITSEIGAAVNVLDGNFRGAWETLKQGGKDAAAEFKGLGKEFSTGWEEAVKRFSDGVDRINGKTKALTTEHAAILKEILERELAHQQALAQVRISAIDFELENEDTKYEKKLELIREKEEIALQVIVEAERTKAAELKIQRDQHQISEKTFQAQMTTLERQSFDQQTSIAQKSSQDILKIHQDRTNKIRGIFQSQVSAMAGAFSQQILQTHNLGDALKAAGAAQIQTLANQAATEISIRGAKAAAAAYEGGASVGGPFAAISGAVAAAPVVAYYAGLAAIVGTAGALVSNAITSTIPSGGGGAPASSGGGGSYEQANSGVGSPGFDGVAQPVPGLVSGSGPGAAGASAGTRAAGGGGPISVYVYLDGEVLFRAVGQASADGRLAISMKGLVP